MQLFPYTLLGVAPTIRLWRVWCGVQRWHERGREHQAQYQRGK